MAQVSPPLTICLLLRDLIGEQEQNGIKDASAETQQASSCKAVYSLSTQQFLQNGRDMQHMALQ